MRRRDWRILGGFIAVGAVVTAARGAGQEVHELFRAPETPIRPAVLPIAGGQPPLAPIVVMTWNCDHALGGNNSPPATNQINAHRSVLKSRIDAVDPDILLVQEWYNLALLEELNASLVRPFPYIISTAVSMSKETFPGRMWDFINDDPANPGVGEAPLLDFQGTANGTYANIVRWPFRYETAILSRFPINPAHSWEVEIFTPVPPPGNAERRYSNAGLFTRLTVGGAPLWVASVHFASGIPRGAQREAQARFLVEQMEEKGCNFVSDRVIVGGDLNGLPDNIPIDPLVNHEPFWNEWQPVLDGVGLRNAWTGVPDTAARWTVLAMDDEDSRTIDHIYTRNLGNPVAERVPASGRTAVQNKKGARTGQPGIPPDHWAVMIEIDLCGDCPTDVDGNGVVNVLDLLAVLAAWSGRNVPEDVNCDETVNVLDLLAVLGSWGPCE